MRDTRHYRDGDSIIVLDFFVTVETESGRRFNHSHMFCGTVEHDDIDFLAYGRDGDKAAAERLAQRVEKHLRLGGTLDLRLWNEVDPAYGSRAYRQLDSLGYFRQREIEESNGFRFN